ncbi:MAG: hypothetical protein GQ557_02845 [Mycoplasmataceae bacterium]|nr:hypothetical protein [Mycoplasmataceae bacterium]
MKTKSKSRNENSRIIKKSKKKIVIILIVISTFLLALGLTLFFSLKYYAPNGHEFMKTELDKDHVVTADEAGDAVQDADPDQYTGIMFDSQDDVSDHVFYGMTADETKRKNQEVESGEPGWTSYIRGEKIIDWYYVDSAKSKGVNSYDSPVDAMEEFLLNKDQDGVDTNFNGLFNVDIPVIYQADETDNQDIFYNQKPSDADSIATDTIKFTWSVGLDQNISDEDLYFSTISNTDATTSHEPMLFDSVPSLKTSWWIFRNGTPVLIFYGLDYGQFDVDETETDPTNEYPGSDELWQNMDDFFGSRT